MKRLIRLSFLLLSCLLLSNYSYGQRPYLVFIEDMPEFQQDGVPKITKGMLVHLRDSSIVFRVANGKADSTTLERPIFTIQQIKVRKKNQVLRWSAIGLLTGIAAFTTFAYIVDYEPSEIPPIIMGIGSGVYFSPFTVPAGATVGVLLQKKFVINGSQDQYLLMKNQLLESSLPESSAPQTKP